MFLHIQHHTKHTHFPSHRYFQERSDCKLASGSDSKCSLCTGPVRQKAVDSIVRWMTLVQNQCTNLRDKAHVIVVGSHADVLIGRSEDPCAKESTFAPVFKSFSKLEFVSFTATDCRFADTGEIKLVKKLIQKSSAILRSPETVSLNAHTFYIYLLESFKGDLAVSLKEVEQRIHRDLNEVKSERTKNLLSFIPNTLPHLQKICDQLSKKGLILYLHNKKTQGNSFYYL